MNKNKTLTILFLSLIILPIVTFLLIRTNSRMHPSNGKTKIQECVISNENLCDGKVVTIKGIVESATITPEFGFELTNDVIQNPLYITAVRYDGVEITSNSEKKEYVQIPFGQSVIVTGVITASESAWCTQRDYALDNEETCKPGKSRIRITPTSIITENTSLSDQHIFSIQGKFRDYKGKITSCPQVTTFCEDNSATCYKVEIEQNYCSTLVNKSNSFVLKGYSESMQQPLYPTSMISYSGISFTSQEIDEKMENRITRLTPNKLNKIGIFDQEGKQISQITQSNSNYYNLNKVLLFKDGVLYFDKNTIYYQPFTNTTPQKIRTLSSDFLEYEDDLASAKVSPDEEYIVARISNEISSKPLENTQYMVRKNRYSIVKIPLDTNSPIETLFEKEMDGFMSLTNYDFTSQKAIVDYSYDLEQPEDCKKTHTYKIDIKTKTESKIFEEVTQGNNNCTDVIYEKLYTSPDGNTIVSGKDFNSIVGGTIPGKLVIDTVTLDNSVKRREILIDRPLLQALKFNVQALEKNKLNVILPSFPFLLYSIDLDNDYIEFASLTSRLDTDQRFPEYPENMSGAYTPITNIQYVDEEKDVMYLRSRGTVGFDLYRYNMKTNRLIMLESFSSLSRHQVFKDKMYTVDFIK